MLRWITAVSFAVGSALSASAAPAQPVWVTAWTASPAPDRLDGTPQAPVQFAAQTVRQDMRLGSRADALRLRISNELGVAPLRLQDVTVQGPSGTALPVKVAGRDVIEVPVGAALLTDVVPLQAAALDEIRVTGYFPQATRPAVRRTTVRVVDGRHPRIADSVAVSYRQNVFSAVLVQRADRPSVIVALGDSITEGATAQRGAYNQWPERLAVRLQNACPDRFVVLNQGISGNKLLDHGRSHSALSRLDRDVIATSAGTAARTQRGGHAGRLPADRRAAAPARRAGLHRHADPVRWLGALRTGFRGRAHGDQCLGTWAGQWL